MTVKDLKDKIQFLPDDLPVRLMSMDDARNEVEVRVTFDYSGLSDDDMRNGKRPFVPRRDLSIVTIPNGDQTTLTIQMIMTGAEWLATCRPQV